MSLYCDKDCQNITTVCVVLILASLFTGYVCPNTTVKIVCIILTIIILLSLILAQNGGYNEYIQTPEEVDRIENLRNKLRTIIPEPYIDIPIVSSSESYTFRKKKIFLCLGDFPDNTLLYVLIHEFCHAMCPPEPDPHSPKWKSIFDEYLQKAIDKGVYNKQIGIDPNYMKQCAAKNS